MFSNRLSAEQSARCNAAGRMAIGRHIASIYNMDSSEPLPESLQRLIDELRKGEP
jgi:hypothetical protein